MSESPKTDAGSRWWEYYFVRYFVGTVTGAAIVGFLFKFPGSSLYSPGLTVSKDFDNFGVKEITGLAALGFAYCYVASAPMLLFHATRSQFGLRRSRLALALWIATSAVAAIMYFLIASRLSIRLWSHQGAALLVFLVILVVQIAKIAYAELNRLKIISDFYRGIAEARASEKPWVSQYVESYRHLREHGNATAILVFELLLAFVLYSVCNFAYAVAVMLLWLLPSTYTWIIGSTLESRLVRMLNE